MTKRLSQQEKENRRPASRACVFCHLKHLQCSNTRPCQNCIKRNIAHQCRDVERKKAKYMAQEAKSEPEIDLRPELAHSTPSTSTTNFNLNFLNQEYMMLGDLILKPLLPTDVLMTDPMVAAVFDSEESRPFIALGDPEVPALPSQPGPVPLLPSQPGKPEEKYISPLVSHHIYQTVQDIYANKIVLFDYPQLYHSLTHFLKQRFSISGKNLLPEEAAGKKKNLLIILKLIASYRPTFISAHKSLFKPFDFHFLEMSFQRCLLDYENLLRLNASPTIIWRRTGEIVSISNDLVNLLGLSSSEVLSKRTFIMELMFDDDSIVEYFRLFKSVAVGNLRLTIVTRCKLIRRTLEPLLFAKTNTRFGDYDYIDFCSAWTVKRDLFDIPMMVVGQFLPMLSK